MTDLVNAIVLLANFVLIPATVYACQLALGALGVTLVYGVLRFSNFAHGETMAFGAMVTILLTWLLQSWQIGIGPLPTALLALPAGIAATGGLCLVTDRWVYRFYRRRKAAPVILLVASVGVMFVLNGLIRFVIGPDDQVFTDGTRFVVSVRQFKGRHGTGRGTGDQDHADDHRRGDRDPGAVAVLVPGQDAHRQVDARPTPTTRTWPCCPASTRNGWWRSPG